MRLYKYLNMSPNTNILGIATVDDWLFEIDSTSVSLIVFLTLKLFTRTSGTSSVVASEISSVLSSLSVNNSGISS